MLVVDFSSSSIHGFWREKYLNTTRYDVSVIIPLSLNRIDRLSYLLTRWKGEIVIGLYTSADDIETAARIVHKFSSISRLKFILYVRDNLPSIQPFYRGTNGKKHFESIFPINFLRDLCIESISTTHYLYLDGDVFVSDNLYSIILYSQPVLANPSNVLLLMLFQYNPKRVSSYCMNHNFCQRIWNSIPRSYSSLKSVFDNQIISFDTPMHNTLNAKK